MKDLQASNKGFVFVAFACQARILLPEGESDRLCSTFTNLYVCHVTAVCMCEALIGRECRSSVLG